MMPELIEIKDGLLADADNVIMKARGPGLFPDQVQEYFMDKTKVPEKMVLRGNGNVTVSDGERVGVFDPDIFDYVFRLDIKAYYMSNVQLPWEKEILYPLFAEYKHGWVVVAPKGAE